MLRDFPDASAQRTPILRVVALAAASLLLIQCRPAPQATAPPPANAPAPATSDLRPLVVAPPPPLTRQELITAASIAAASYAERSAPMAADPLVGRTFAIRAGFGCSGPDPIEETADGRPRWWWGPSHTTIKINLKPADVIDSGVVPIPAPGSNEPPIEAAEGFWISRPWLLADGCPTHDQGPQPPLALAPPSPDTLGLVTLFQADSSRAARRRGRAYSFVQRGVKDAPLAGPAHGYRVVFEGRVSGFPDGQAIRCRSASIDQRPVCVMAVQLDRVAFEDGQSGTIIAEWREG